MAMALLRATAAFLLAAAAHAGACEHACTAPAHAAPRVDLTPARGARVQRPARYNISSRRAAGKVNVHIIPHTHDDVGWLKTVDQYFYGANNSIQHANVASIIGASINALLEDPDRKFIYVEQAFFTRWWSEQTPAKRAAVQGLVASGQLEFINGGWSMHDEACPSYIDMIDNTALGQRLVFDTFGVVPKTTWQIDPFGHSAFQGSMLSSPLAGVNGVYVARMDYQDIDARKAYSGTEMFWAPSPSQPLQGGVLGFLPFWYYAPGGFNFGGDDGTQPVMDDADLEDYNVADVVARFNALIDSQVNFTAGEDVMIMMATDFSGENAETWFRNIDKLIHWVNLAGGPGGGGKYNALYSTPSAYTAAKAATTPLPLREEDVMPYADGPHAFWSGYFSSRPALKGYVRDSSAVFQAAKQMQALTGGVATSVDDPAANALYLLERAMGVTQHHDAVSGTSKQHVANDYARRLARGRLAADGAIAAALAALTGDAAAAFASCDLANVTICPALENGSAPVALAVWNSLSTAAAAVRVRVPVAAGATWAVLGANGVDAVPAQLDALSDADTHLRADYYQYAGAPVQWLSFTTPAPAMGYATVFLVPTKAAAAAPRAAPRAAAAPFTLSNGLVNLTFDATGRLATLASAALGWQAQPFTQSFAYYNSSTGNAPRDDSPDHEQSSGAYIFRPNSSTLFPVGAGVTTTLVAAGPVVWEVRQTFASWATQSVRLWAGADDVEFESTVGPIPFTGAENTDGEGREVVTRYTTGLATAGTWVSDSNGRDAITRVRDSRRSWNYTVIERVAGNFVPVNLFTSLTDASTTLSVVTDRTQAGSSMVDGELELMVHRRLQHDDNRGVGEPLNETGLDGAGLIVRSVHRVALAPAAGAGAALRAAAGAALFHPVLSFAPLATAPAAWAAAHATTFSGLNASLPANVGLVTVQSLAPGTLLVRVAHLFAAGEDATLSAPATVALGRVFAKLSVTAATEMTLPGTIPLANAPVSTFTTTDGKVVTLPVVDPAPVGPDFAVTVSAMQIKTYRLTVA